MGMSGSMADPQRVELMGRVGVTPYRNDRQERIKRECWWTSTLSDEWRDGVEEREREIDHLYLAHINHREDKQNQVILAQPSPNCDILHRSLLGSDVPLNSIPLFGFIIVALFNSMTQSSPVCQLPGNNSVYSETLNLLLSPTMVETGMHQ